MEGKDLALEEIHGSLEESYSLLPSYVVQVMGVDHAARTSLVHDAESAHCCSVPGHLDLNSVATRVI